LYYGIDVDQFRPAATARPEMAQQLGLPGNKFLALFSSRISHEKDPETAIRAVAQVRARGLEAILLNIGGGYQDFVNLAKKMKVPDYSDWVIGRPAVHPVTEVFKYYQAANVVVQASLAEGLGLTPLEALACGTPVVATEVGGMALELREFARLVPRQNAEAMADQIDWVANNPCEAEEQALRGRDYIVREWSRTRAFEELRLLLEDVSKTYRPSK
jgi:glycosyltransferase involved in cell wall biosynthesis